MLPVELTLLCPLQGSVGPKCTLRNAGRDYLGIFPTEENPWSTRGEKSSWPSRPSWGRGRGAGSGPRLVHCHSFGRDELDGFPDQAISTRAPVVLLDAGGA